MVPDHWHPQTHIVRRTRCVSPTWEYITRWLLSIDRLSRCVQNLQERLSIHGSESGSSESETEYLITPPPSDYSDSRPLSPKHHHAHVTTIHVSQHSPSEEAGNLEKQGKRQSHLNFKYISNMCSLIHGCFCRKRLEYRQTCSDTLPYISTIG